MAQTFERKMKASGSISSDSDICSHEGKKACNSPRSEPNISAVFSEDNQVLEALNITEKITTKLEQFFEMLAVKIKELDNKILYQEEYNRPQLFKRWIALSSG